MSADSRPLGTCRFCDSTIPEHRVLIRYETSEGEKAVYAECPDCGEVVQPD